MQFVDMHCDSLLKVFMRGKEGADLYDSSEIAVDFKRMKEGGQMAQFFAAFLFPREPNGYVEVPDISDDEYLEGVREILLTNVEKYSDQIAMAHSGQDVETNWNQGKMSAILTIEDGRSVEGSLDKLKHYHDLGFRAISLTWNAHNCFGAPNSADPEIMKEGLTAFGKEAVEYMQELGILVDVSHLSEGGFYDVAEICKKPFVATHSNAYALCASQRNLTDDQLRILGNAGGVTGINFAPFFLNADMKCMESKAEVMAKHARYMTNVGGMDCVGIGSDLDGIMGELEIDDCSKMYLLEHALKKEGFSEGEIEKIFYKNVLRAMKDAIG